MRLCLKTFTPETVSQTFPIDWECDGTLEGRLNLRVALKLHSGETGSTVLLLPWRQCYRCLQWYTDQYFSD